jgi:hypothetical protein
MTDIAIRFPQTKSAAALESPISWRLRGAAMATAFVLGTAAGTATVRPTDHGVIVASSPSTPSTPTSPSPATAGPASAFTVVSIAPVSAGSLRVIA